MILSNVNFPGGVHRTGGEKDCELMEKLFGKGGLGLETFVRKDLSMQVWSTLCRAWFILCDVLRYVQTLVWWAIQRGLNPDISFFSNGKGGSAAYILCLFCLMENSKLVSKC